MIINKFQIKQVKITIAICLVCFNSCKINQHKKTEESEDYYVKEKYKEIDNYEIEAVKYDQLIFSELVKSVQIGTKSISTGEPCYPLGSNDNVIIDFDILKENIESLQYEIIHCNKNWEKSNLMEMEYIEGFAINFIENNEISHGPLQQYIHYNFEVPNENLNFIKSGNYIIKVFYENEIETPLMSIKLFVSEQISTIDFNLLKSNNMEERKYIQTHDINCTYNSQNINDPYSNIFVNIQQNHQEFDEHWLNGPNFIRENKLVFLADEDLFFDGSNEFRFFEMSTFRHGSQNIKKIFLNDNSYKVILKKDIKRSYKQYLEYKDLDGRYFTRTYDNDDINSQGEYGLVDFELPIREKIKEDIYLFGELSNWSINQSFKMKYDSISRSYKNSILLKQGYYNYLYITKDDGKISTRQLEGAHYDTNNEYIVKVYYRDPLELYDRLLGYQVFKINS